MSGVSRFKICTFELGKWITKYGRAGTDTEGPSRKSRRDAFEAFPPK